MKRKKVVVQNTLAVEKLARMVSTCFGPNAMSKMMIDEFAGIVITNDGWRVLKECDIAHPASKLLVDVTTRLHESLGDGSTSALLLCDAILQGCVQLLYSQFHDSVPESVVCDHLREICHLVCHEFIRNLVIDSSSIEDRSHLVKHMVTQVLNTKHASSKFIEELTSIVVQVLQLEGLVGEHESRNSLQTSIVKIPFSEISQSKVLPNTTVVAATLMQNPQMVRSKRLTLNNVRVCVATCSFDIPNRSHKRHVVDPNSFARLEHKQELWWTKLVERIVEHKISVLLVTQKVSVRLAQLLAEKKVFVFHIQDTISDRELLAISHGCNSPALVTSVAILFAEDTACGLVEQLQIHHARGTQFRLYIENSTQRNISVILRGPSMEFLNEIEIAVSDTLQVSRKSLLEMDYAFVYGAGCIETQIMHQIEEYISSHNLTNTVKGQVFQSFAKALQVIPRTLLSNSLPQYNDMILEDRLNALRAGIRSGNSTGINGYDGTVRQLSISDKDCPIDPAILKRTIIEVAVDCSCAILKVDSIVLQQLLPRVVNTGILQ